LLAFIFFIFYFFGKKNEFWGITQNWVMTITIGWIAEIIGNHKGLLD
jgi:hypothetical protein